MRARVRVRACACVRVCVRVRGWVGGWVCVGGCVCVWCVCVCGVCVLEFRSGEPPKSRIRVGFGFRVSSIETNFRCRFRVSGFVD